MKGMNLVFSALLVLTFNFLPGQKIGIQIVVIDKESKKPIPESKVFIFDYSPQPEYTGNQGTVFFKSIEANKRIRVKIEHTGHQSYDDYMVFNNLEKIYEVELLKDVTKVYSFFGRVTNQENKGIVNAKVVINVIGFPQIQNTDSDGYYRIEVDNKLIEEAIEYTISAEHGECSASKPFAEKTKIPKNKNIETNFVLECKLSNSRQFQNIKQDVKIAFLDINTPYEFFLKNSNIFSESSAFISELKNILEASNKGVSNGEYEFNCNDFLKGPNISKQPDPNAYKSYYWKNFNYYTRLARWVAIDPSPRKTNDFYESVAKQKFCGVTQYLVSKPDNSIPSDSTYLEHLLRTYDQNYRFFKPTLVIGLYRKKSTKEESNIDLMFRYPAYNLSSNDMINYPLENRTWYIAASQKKTTLIFPFGINGFTCGLSYPYTDYRLNIQTRTCWCSKIDEEKGEEIIVGVDFSLNY